ncbi:MAG: hypothetical protein V4598_05700 [Bdellovibrionota bacterium]
MAAFSSLVSAGENCKDLDEYSAIFKKEIANFQVRFDKDMKDPRILEKTKKSHLERLSNEKIMCQIALKKPQFDHLLIFNEGVQAFITTESSIMYNEKYTMPQILAARYMLVRCYCELKEY